VTLSREQLDEVYRQFTVLADGKKGIMDEEIRELALRVRGDALGRKIA
jgi:hypothetical protein